MIRFSLLASRSRWGRLKLATESGGVSPPNEKRKTRNERRETLSHA